MAGARLAPPPEEEAAASIGRSLDANEAGAKPTEEEEVGAARA